jgi:replicative DNA helicase
MERAHKSEAPPETRELPVNLPVERAVLGALIESEQILSDALKAGLRENDFSISDHQRIFAAIVALREKYVPVDQLSVAEQLGNGQWDVALIGDLINGAVIVRSHVAHHVQIVRKKSDLRQLAKMGDWLTTAACRTGAEPNDLTAQLLKQLSAAGLESDGL